MLKKEETIEEEHRERQKRTWKRALFFSLPLSLFLSFPFCHSFLLSRSLSLLYQIVETFPAFLIGKTRRVCATYACYICTHTRTKRFTRIRRTHVLTFFRTKREAKKKKKKIRFVNISKTPLMKYEIAIIACIIIIIIITRIFYEAVVK